MKLKVNAPLDPGFMPMALVYRDFENAVKNVLAHTNLPVYEVFNMASLNPATAIGCADRLGSLDAGKDADIIITDETINVLRTIKKGRTIYEA